MQLNGATVQVVVAADTVHIMTTDWHPVEGPLGKDTAVAEAEFAIALSPYIPTRVSTAVTYWPYAVPSTVVLKLKLIGVPPGITVLTVAVYQA